MLDATPEITATVRAAIMAEPGLASIGDRISTDWGLPLAPPYVRLQVPTVRPFEDDCAGDGTEHRLTVHVFTKERGTSQRSQFAGLVRKVLHRAALPLATSSLWWCEFRDGQNYTDPEDPELQIARLVFEIVTTN